jgi:hypothetical protein
VSGSKFESARRETGAGELRRAYVRGVRTPQAHSPARWGIGGVKIVSMDPSCRRPAVAPNFLERTSGTHRLCEGLRDSNVIDEREVSADAKS